MPSGRKPNVNRRRQVARLLCKGLTLTEIARQFGVSKQAVWSLLKTRPQRTSARAVAGRPRGRGGEGNKSPRGGMTYIPRNGSKHFR